MRLIIGLTLPKENRKSPAKLKNNNLTALAHLPKKLAVNWIIVQR
jgi:hypothetical protein